MSEIRLNIIDDTQTVSGTLHGSFGSILIAALTAEPETVPELERAAERFYKDEFGEPLFRFFDPHENFEPYDAGLVAIDLAARSILVDSSYDDYSKEGLVRIRTDDGEDFDLPYELSDDWKFARSLPAFEFLRTAERRKRAERAPFDARRVLFGTPLFEFLAAAAADEEPSAAAIHARWLMTPRSDLGGKTPRELLLEKRDFISSDLHYRSLQWSFTKVCPPPLSIESAAFRFAGFGTHEIVVYHRLIRFLLDECAAGGAPEPARLEKLAAVWLNAPQADFSDRAPAAIVEAERRRLNLTVPAHEALIDDDCEICRLIAADFDTPLFWFLDGAELEAEGFEFSFYRTRAEWDEEQRRFEEFSRRCRAAPVGGDDFYDWPFD
ncbi:MAG: hypothetical protein JSS81_12720 [Acidobacteria bacterium]|nr:hypothetical protein [Acidobacteriota bacterium]